MIGVTPPSNSPADALIVDKGRNYSYLLSLPAFTSLPNKYNSVVGFRAP